MTPADKPASPSVEANSPASFLAAAAALHAIDDALHAARHQAPDAAETHDVGQEQALASLLLLRQVREQLAGWETGLIETARDAGASWADLAQPLGVASRQAAERRTCATVPARPEPPANNVSRPPANAAPAERTTVTWARRNAADLRRIAGQITALTDLPTAACLPLGQLNAALAHDDPAELIRPLHATRPTWPPLTPNSRHNSTPSHPPEPAGCPRVWATRGAGERGSASPLSLRAAGVAVLERHVSGGRLGMRTCLPSDPSRGDVRRGKRSILSWETIFISAA